MIMGMFDPHRAETRFGCGLSPRIAPPDGVAQMLRRLAGPDHMARRFPVPEFDDLLPQLREERQIRRTMRRNKGSEIADEARDAYKRLKKSTRSQRASWTIAHLQRRIHSNDGFRERLEAFWADHFTATGKGGLMALLVSPYVQSALRPHMTGRFEDLLFHAVTHPMMVHYLDQNVSTGPNSRRAQQKPGQGLNENLAREILELHTLGVGAPYDQGDVRQLAELLTGLTFNARKGRAFKANQAEPGSETVLGVTYGGAKPGLRDIQMVLRDLARHPATARHLARKLAVHFVADRPDPDLVTAIETAWMSSDGDLIEVYKALLSHPSAWKQEGGNFKQPFDFVTSSMRALDVSASNLTGKTLNRLIMDPMRAMGHRWQRPDGPDGLAEEDARWVTPQGLAARLQWALVVPGLLRRDLPDPRKFVTTALGPNIPEAVRFAAHAAESRSDGVGLILASPAFQRV
jgi:uncharacterized protein (DUF1800 family)